MLDMFIAMLENSTGDVRELISLPNGYEAGIRRTPETAGNERGLFELHIMDDEHNLIYKGEHSDGIIGSLTATETMEHVKHAFDLPSRDGSPMRAAEDMAEAVGIPKNLAFSIVVQVLMDAAEREQKRPES